MIIILMYIPANTGNQAIKDFIEPAIKGGLLRKSGEIEKISILALKNIITDKMEYHGLVTIMPDAVANRVIKKLSKKHLNGRRVVLREFQIRSWHNDPRISRKDLTQRIRNKRHSDRRHRCMEVKLKAEQDDSMLFSVETRFSNKFKDH